MTALTAFELLIKCERARWYSNPTSDEGQKLTNDALDSVRNELSRCIKEMLTPDTNRNKK